MHNAPLKIRDLDLRPNLSLDGTHFLTSLSAFTFAIFGATNCTELHFVTPFYNVAYFSIGITQTSFAHIISLTGKSFLFHDLCNAKIDARRVLFLIECLVLKFTIPSLKLSDDG